MQAENPSSKKTGFIKADAGKGCSPSLIPVKFRLGLRNVAAMQEWYTDNVDFDDVYGAVEGYETGSNHWILIDAAFKLGQLNGYQSLAHYLWGIAEVMDMGAKKYSRDNWMKCDYDERYRYLDAFYRHAYAMQMGEVLDQESGKPHAAHAACCLAMLHGIIEIKKRGARANPQPESRVLY
jgi:hypothetical protein